VAREPVRHFRRAASHAVAGEHPGTGANPNLLRRIEGRGGAITGTHWLRTASHTVPPQVLRRNAFLADAEAFESRRVP